MAAIGANADDACANCGGPGDDLADGPALVRRVYVTVDDRGRVTGSETMSAPERWCASCRSLYPHVPGGSDPPGAVGGGPPAGGGSS